MLPCVPHIANPGVKHTQVLLNTSMLSPQQMVGLYVQAWPWLPVLPPIFDALDELRAASAGFHPESPRSPDWQGANHASRLGGPGPSRLARALRHASQQSSPAAAQRR